MKKKIYLLAFSALFTTNALLAGLANGGFESTTGPIFCPTSTSIIAANSWDGLRISYLTGNCATPTFSNGTASGVDLFAAGLTNTCVDAPARTGTKAAHLEFRGFYQNQTASCEWLKQTLTGGFIGGRKYTLTAFVNTLGSPLIVTPSSNPYQIGFRMVNTSAGSTTSAILNNAKAQVAQPVTVTNAGGGWVKLTLVWTSPLSSTYNLVFGAWASDVFCNDANFSILCKYNVDDVSVTCFADAGPDKQNTCYFCCTPPVTGVQIGTNAISGFTYSWSPGGTLNNPNTAQPTASPCGSTNYTLTVTSSGGECAAGTDVVFVNTLTNQACCRVAGGVSDTKPPFEFNVYPNPSKDGNLFVEIPMNYEKLNITVVNGHSGTVIYSKKYTGLKQSEKVKLVLPAKTTQKEERVLMITEPGTENRFSLKLL